MVSMASSNGRLSRTSTEQNTKAHESQIYTEVSCDHSFEVHHLLSDIQLMDYKATLLENNNWVSDLGYSIELTVISFRNINIFSKIGGVKLSFHCFQVGLYKGMLVAVKKVNKQSVHLSRDDLLELKVVSNLRPFNCLN